MESNLDLARSLGIGDDKFEKYLTDYIDFNLRFLGCKLDSDGESEIAAITETMMHTSDEIRRRLAGFRTPVDGRIERFLSEFLADLPASEQREYWLPNKTFVCDRFGVSRRLSLPKNGDEFHSEYVDTYRLHNGILNNPGTDRRTTKDVFHVVEGGLNVPPDKKAVPKVAFARMLYAAFNPSDDLLVLPFTSTSNNPAKMFVSAYVKPVICPAVKDVMTEKRMEIRVFLPGSLVSILDSVESIFGNAGSPMLPENDSALDPDSWTGHTGCIVFAPQLRKMTKKSLGLPHISEATDRQKRDGMCWEDEKELYHDGKAFKVMARAGGGMISIIADSYNGYGKKEIKTQMSYAANMFGLCEEEHSGGAIAFPRYDLGYKFKHKDFYSDHTFDGLVRINSENMKIDSRRFANDINYNEIVYLPEDAEFSLNDLKISWKNNGVNEEMLFELDKIYIMPSGYRVELVKPKTDGDRWKMIGTRPDGTFCYKPATVSGGGKSEIAKPIVENIIHGSVVIADYSRDMAVVEKILSRDYSDRFKDKNTNDNRSILDKHRSLGSVIKLLTPNDDYTDEYNAWLGGLSQIIKEMVFVVKAYYKEDWGSDWRSHFKVDSINGMAGNQLRYEDHKLIENYLRVGFDANGGRRIFSLRDDFYPASKLQLADDITSAVILPAKDITGLQEGYDNKSVKFVHNCEYRLYQRPDEAITPGYDYETESDMCKPNLFTCNFRPLTREDVQKIKDDSILFSSYTQPMQNMMNDFLHDINGPKFFVCPSELRQLADGTKSKNQRYLQDRQDISDPKSVYLVKLGIKLNQNLNSKSDVKFAVNAVLTGRRNNPTEKGVRPLCVYNPLHYMDLPELFMEYISSMTGKSPSTTGAGLEGAMTKGPFNSISTVYDLNSALLGFILTGYKGFLSSAGYIGPKFRVDHDITYIIPEIWSRMKIGERNPQYLIDNGLLEKCKNMSYNGKEVLFERLGYRITKKFVEKFAGRIFSSPGMLFADEMLKPELQDMDVFADSMDNIVGAHQRAANLLIDDGSVDEAIPPLKALLNIMAYGSYDGMNLSSPKFRSLFDIEYVLNSDWYKARLINQQKFTIEHISRGIDYIENVINRKNYESVVHDLQLNEKLSALREKLIFVKSDKFISTLVGTIGRCDK